MKQIKLFDADQWEEIFDSLSRNKARTFLTAFGIFWGVFMLILLMGGGRGLKTSLSQNFAGTATNAGYIIASPTSEPYKGFRAGRSWTLELKDVKRIKACVPEVDVVTPIICRWRTQAAADNSSTRVSLQGIYGDYYKVVDANLQHGRPLIDADGLQRRKVCVIGSRVADELFPRKANPCGEFIQIDSISYCVVGVCRKGSSGMAVSDNPEITVCLPYQTMQSMYNRGGEVDFLCLTAYSQWRMSDVQDKVEQLIKRVHMIHPKDAQAVFKLNTEAIFLMVDSLFSGVSILVWMIGLGTLIAGAIGVSNILVVTVKERTTEIGIRRAIGATPLNILYMIMTESIVLTLIAGMSGITVAVGILQLLENKMQEEAPGAEFQISFWVAIGAASLLALLGVLAGLAPAIRAMRIKPVDAMREE